MIPLTTTRNAAIVAARDFNKVGGDQATALVLAFQKYDDWQDLIALAPDSDRNRDQEYRIFEVAFVAALQ